MISLTFVLINGEHDDFDSKLFYVDERKEAFAIFNSNPYHKSFEQ